MSHIWMSHVTHMNESCHTQCIEHWMSHVTHMNMTWLIHMCDMTHIQKGDVNVMEWQGDVVPHMNESCHTYEWVMSHTYEWVMSHIWMSHVTHMNESCLTHMNESCHTYEWVMATRRCCCHSITVCVCESCHTYEWVMATRRCCCHSSTVLLSLDHRVITSFEYMWFKTCVHNVLP